MSTSRDEYPQLIHIMWMFGDNTRAVSRKFVDKAVVAVTARAVH